MARKSPNRSLIISGQRCRSGIKYLVLTHYHMDHTGGMRTYVAEGATVIVPTPDKAYFEKDVQAPRSLVPDDLQKNRGRRQGSDVAEG
jgi:glyoxylase-like metal-dependent hydrolase (beta-lactamase superfamily II)